ncbi:hypothetical protein BD779DRAFT_1674662 [Infundibulicybe gibba]|nr:hypothetical protein BD779DRAFT_1674662 [Infundibulicybe gibba]
MRGKDTCGYYPVQGLHKLPDTSIIIRLFGITPTIGCVISSPIVDRARSEAAEFRYKYRYRSTLNTPTRRLADTDQHTAMRPLGMLFIGTDAELGPQPFQPNFVGYFAGFHAAVAG